MKLRLLERDDAFPMLEWMHDTDVVSVLPTSFEKMTIEDCFAFIETAKISQEKDLHLAICDSNEDYLGTVSLKNINVYSDSTAPCARSFKTTLTEDENHLHGNCTIA